MPHRFLSSLVFATVATALYQLGSLKALHSLRLRKCGAHWYVWQGLSRCLEDVGFLQSKTVSLNKGGVGGGGQMGNRQFTPSYLTCEITAKGSQWLRTAAQELPKLELVESDELKAEDREQQAAKRREEVCQRARSLDTRARRGFGLGLGLGYPNPNLSPNPLPELSVCPASECGGRQTGLANARIAVGSRTHSVQEHRLKALLVDERQRIARYETPSVRRASRMQPAL